MPYGVNVNVGKILPNNVMADNWTYQSRVPNTAIKYAYTLGAESPAPSAIANWGKLVERAKLAQPPEPVKLYRWMVAHHEQYSTVTAQ